MSGPVRTMDGVYCAWCVTGAHTDCERTLAEQTDPAGEHTRLCACSHREDQPCVPGAGQARMYPANSEAVRARRAVVAAAHRHGDAKPPTPR